MSLFVLTRELFVINEILSAVSTDIERKEYLAKMNYYPNTWRGAPRGAGPDATASLHRLEAGPTLDHVNQSCSTEGKVSPAEFLLQEEK